MMTTIYGMRINYKEPLTNNSIEKPGKTALDAICKHIKHVEFHEPATIVFWDDNTKTVVKCAKGEAFDKETGIAMAVLKKLNNNKSSFNTILKKYAK